MNEIAAKATSESVMLAASKSSHLISKSYCAAKDEGRRATKNSKHKIITTRTLRIVYVYEPETIITDPQNFRSLVQKLTGKPPHKSMEKKRQTNLSGPSCEVASAKFGTENVQHTFYSNDQMPIMENESTKFSIEDCSGFSKAIDDIGMIDPDLASLGILHDHVHDHFYSNNQMPIMESKITNFSIEDYSGFTGFSDAFNETDMIFPGGIITGESSGLEQFSIL